MIDTKLVNIIVTPREHFVTIHTITAITNLTIVIRVTAAIIITIVTNEKTLTNVTTDSSLCN